MKRRNVTFFVLVVFICWNVMTYFFIAYKPPGKQDTEYGAGVEVPINVAAKVAELQQKIEEQASLHEELLRQLENIRHGIVKDIVDRHPEQEGGEQDKRLGVDSKDVVVKDQNLLPSLHGGGGGSVRLDSVDPDSVVLPVLVIACNRVSVNRNLDQLIKYRPSAERFPIVVSQDCGDKNTAEVIRSYGDQVTHIQHPDLSDIKLPPKEKKFQGYFKIARHYKWALHQIFSTYNHQAAIIIEDDLNISPDFFEYFAATFRILVKDPSLWCVSAWNDNGKGNMVESNPELLYRTDFFPGLGWMLTKDTWLELEDKWPKTFWDDWMRHPDQRKDRACIRPEISRTSTFGKIGVSKGQFFEKHLKFIKLNEVFVPFTKMDLSYLSKEKYDEAFAKKVYSLPLLQLHEVLSRARMELKEVRVQYSDKDGFKKTAKLLGIMEDLKSGVPRAGYRGVVSFMKDGRRVYFAPPPDWKAYNKDWN